MRNISHKRRLILKMVVTNPLIKVFKEIERIKSV
jgi:hypothetical protein